MADQYLNLLFGYGSEPVAALTTFIDDHPDLAGQISDAIADLEAIDTQLRAARADSMALEVGDLKVDYGKHVAHLRSEGSLILKRLESITGVPLRYNKYTGRSLEAKSTNSVVSYW